MLARRWAGQGALVKKTLYYYGGQATLTPNEIANSWTNALLSVDLSRNWPIGQPALRLLQPDSGNPRSPPAVSRTFSTIPCVSRPIPTTKELIL